MSRSRTLCSRRDRRCIRAYTFRLNARRWWSSGWNQINTAAVLYSVLLSLAIWQAPGLLHPLSGGTPMVPEQSRVEHDRQRELVRMSELRSGDRTEAHQTYVVRSSAGWRNQPVVVKPEVSR